MVRYDQRRGIRVFRGRILGVYLRDRHICVTGIVSVVEEQEEMTLEPVTIRAALMSPCHPKSRLMTDPKRDPPNTLRCEECRRTWLLGVCIPLDEIILYSTQAALDATQDDLS